jgi:ferritin-like metal-binding protein YciE
MKRHHNRYVGLLLKAYTQQVQDLYDFERQLVDVLSQLAAEPSNQDLTMLLAAHVQQTEDHVARLAQIIRRLNVRYPTTHSRDTSYLLTNLKRLLKEPGHARDSRHEIAILSALLEAKAFEVGCSATAHSYARLLSFHDDLAPLEKTYGEQKAMEETIERLLAGVKAGVGRGSELQLSF